MTDIKKYDVMEGEFIVRAVAIALKGSDADISDVTRKDVIWYLTSEDLDHPFYENVFGMSMSRACACCNAYFDAVSAAAKGITKEGSTA